MIGKNFIFIEPPKNATSSVREALADYADECFESVRPDSIFSEGGEINRHVSAWQLLKFFNGYLWDKTFKFSVIRNPYDRLLSEYKYSLKVSQPWKKGRVEGGKKDRYRLKTIELFKIVSNFEEYVFYLYEQFQKESRRVKTKPMRAHLEILGNYIQPRLFPLDHILGKSQFSMLFDPYGAQLVDNLCKFENLDKDFKVICDKLNLSNIKLPKVNATKEASVREAYNGKMIKMVNEILRLDFKHLPYEQYTP
jgi:hypothetical protein